MAAVSARNVRAEADFEERWDTVMKVNVKGSLLMCHAAVGVGAAAVVSAYCVDVQRHNMIAPNIDVARSATMHGSVAGVSTRRSLRRFLVAHRVPVARPCGVQLAVQT